MMVVMYECGSVASITNIFSPVTMYIWTKSKMKIRNWWKGALIETFYLKYSTILARNFYSHFEKRNFRFLFCDNSAPIMAGENLRRSYFSYLYAQWIILYSFSVRSDRDIERKNNAILRPINAWFDSDSNTKIENSLCMV